MSDNLRFLAYVAVAAAIFFGGWMFRGYKADADLNALGLQHANELIAAKAAAEAEVSAIEAEGRAAAEKLANTQRRQRVVYQTIQKEISDAQAADHSDRIPFLSLRWVRLYDDALVPDRDSPDARGEPAGPPAGAGPDDAFYSLLTEWDVLRTHAINAERWASCRAQLNALIDFVEASRDATVKPDASTQNASDD